MLWLLWRRTQKRLTLASADILRGWARDPNMMWLLRRRNRKWLMLAVAVSTIASLYLVLSPLVELIVYISEDRATAELEVDGRRAKAFAANPDGLYLTAFHALEGAEEAQLREWAGSRKTARLKHYNERMDIAVLQVEATPTYRLDIADERLPQAGDELDVRIERYGVPWLEPARVLEVSSSALLLETRLSAGDSGAPVKDREGRVVGMITAKVLDEENTVLAVGTYHLLQALQAARARSGQLESLENGGRKQSEAAGSSSPPARPLGGQPGNFLTMRAAPRRGATAPRVPARGTAERDADPSAESAGKRR